MLGGANTCEGDKSSERRREEGKEGCKGGKKGVKRHTLCRAVEKVRPLLGVSGEEALGDLLSSEEGL